MTKPSDLFKKTGTSSPSGAKVNPFTPIPGLTNPQGDDKAKAERAEHQAESMHGHKIDKGKDLSKNAGKSRGGAGGAGGRPKV